MPRLITARTILALAALAALTAAPPHALCAPRSQTTAPAAGSAAPARQEGRYGDVIVSNSRRIQYKSDFSSGTITGPDTIIDVPDKANSATLRIHADTIVMHQAGGQSAGIIDLAGNVTVHALQHIQKGGGERIVDASAGHGLYLRKEHRFTLDSNVQATIYDESRFDGPGKLSGDKVVLEMRKPDNRYLVSGAPAHNRIDVPLRAQSADHGKLHTRRLQAYRFDEAEMEVGRSAIVHGPASVFTVDDALDQSHAEIHSTDLAASYTEQGGALSQIRAASGARWLFMRVTPDRRRYTQTLSGRSGTVSYDAQTGGCLLAGGVQATLTDPADLLKPAIMTTDRLIAIPSGPSKARVYRYEMSGQAARNRIRFTPIPQPPAVPASAAPAAEAEKGGAALAGSRQEEPAALGDIEVSGFDAGDYEPAKRFEFHGPQLTVTTRDEGSSLRTRFDAPEIAGSWADNQISKIDATGGVRYTATRPVANPAGGTVMETLAGTAASVTYASRQQKRDAAQPGSVGAVPASSGSPSPRRQQREMALHGRFDAELTDPIDLEGPGKIHGDAGDTMSVDLSATPYEFDIDSPKQTATIDFQPRQKQAQKPAAHSGAGAPTP